MLLIELGEAQIHADCHFQHTPVLKVGNDLRDQTVGVLQVFINQVRRMVVLRHPLHDVIRWSPVPVFIGTDTFHGHRYYFGCRFLCISGLTPCGFVDIHVLFRHRHFHSFALF